MGKVITSKGLNEFVESGKVTHVPDHQEKPAEPTKAEVAKVEPVEVKAPPEAPKDDDETVPVLSEDSRKYVNKQHRLRKEAEEQAQDAERFAKDQYTRAVLAEQRAEQLAKDLEEHRKNAPPAPKEPELVEPKEDDPQWIENGQFNWRKFTKAQATYEAAKAVKEERVKQAEERAQADRAQHEAKIRASAEDARKEYSDFDAVMESAKGTEADMVPQFVLNYIYESDLSAQLAYHLAKNPEESQRIAKMKPILGLAELGKLADKLTAKPPEKIPEPKLETPERTGAPPPITPIATTASGTVNTDPARMSFAELRAYERQRNKKR
jgi:hypothetical protein